MRTLFTRKTWTVKKIIYSASVCTWSTLVNVALGVLFICQLHCINTLLTVALLPIVLILHNCNCVVIILWPVFLWLYCIHIFFPINLWAVSLGWFGQTPAHFRISALVCENGFCSWMCHLICMNTCVLDVKSDIQVNNGYTCLHYRERSRVPGVLINSQRVMPLLFPIILLTEQEEKFSHWFKSVHLSKFVVMGETSILSVLYVLSRKHVVVKQEVIKSSKTTA